MPSPHRSTRAAATLFVALALALLVPAAPAWAHNELTSSTPADGAHLTTPPQQILLTFVQRLDPRYTQIVVVTAPGLTSEPRAACRAFGHSGATVPDLHRLPTAITYVSAFYARTPLLALLDIPGRLAWRGESRCHRW